MPGRGASAASKANLKPAARRKRPAKGEQPEWLPSEPSAEARKKGNEVMKANAAHDAETGDLVAEGREIEALMRFAGDGSTTLSRLMRREKTSGELDPALTQRIEALRKLINDIITLRKQITSDAPLIQLADELARRVRTMRTDEDSPPPPPESDDPS